MLYSGAHTSPTIETITGSGTGSVLVTNETDANAIKYYTIMTTTNDEL